MLAIEVTFLTGRFIATAYDDWGRSEWPPHPVRLFSALAATHFQAEASAPDHAEERAVLEWIENLDAPAIAASDAIERDAVTTYVPDNNVALTNVDREAQALEDAQTALAGIEGAADGKRVKSAASQVRRVTVALQKAIGRATEVSTRLPDPRDGQRVLPEYRSRLPRKFPSMTPERPSVTYVWEKASPDNDCRRLLDNLLARLVRLGHSSSLVSARLVDAPDTVTWEPSERGSTFRVPSAGQIAALEHEFRRHRETELRVLPAFQQPYARRVPQIARSVHHTVFSDDWVVFRRVEGPFLPMTATAGVARTVRKAIMSYADQPISEMLSGHGADGRPSEQPHLAIVPLPFVGHEHASGAILGSALMFPRAANANERRHVYTAIRRWEEQFRQEDEDAPAVALNLGAAGQLHIERVGLDVVQSSLRSEVWCRAATVWYSATPVALDRNPGDLHARDPRKLEEATTEAVETICAACERIGLARPQFVEILPAAPWAGAAKARQYPGFPGTAGRTQRVLIHARIEFDNPVRGPIVIGAGRYLGLGLFRPENDR